MCIWEKGRRHSGIQDSIRIAYSPYGSILRGAVYSTHKVVGRVLIVRYGIEQRTDYRLWYGYGIV